MSSLRKEVFACFKKLHKTRKYVFKGDDDKLEKVRVLINDGFRKNKNESDTNKIKEQIQFGNDVDYEIRTTVLQAVEINPNVYRVNIRPEVRKIDNKLFDENAKIDTKPRKKCS